MKTAPRLLLLLAVGSFAIGIPSAQAQWAENGVAVCAASGSQGTARPLPCGSGATLIAWIDNRSGSNYDIYAQKIDASGMNVWTINGVAVSSDAIGDEWYPELASDGGDGAIIVWTSVRGANSEIYAQKIESDGGVAWTAAGVPVCTAANTQEIPHIVSDGSGGAIIIWEDQRNGNVDVYAQRINASGTALWTANGVAICTADGPQQKLEIVPDGSGGAVIAWKDSRSGEGIYGIYAQRIQANGSVMWTANGAAVCTGTPANVPQIISDGSGGAIIAWQDSRSGYLDIYAQRIAAVGTILWAANGVPICAASGNQGEVFLVSDGAGGAIVSWNDWRSGSDSDVYAQRVNADGAVLWSSDGVPVCTNTEMQFSPRICADGAGGAVIAWEDWRGGNYAQKIDANGTSVWTTDGVACCADCGSGDLLVVSDGSGGAVITWSEIGSIDWDVFAQRIDAAGHTVVATLLQGYSVSFAADGIIIAWTLSEIDADVELFVERAFAPDGPFAELPPGTIERANLSFTCIDRDWEPGTTYWYRGGFRRGGERTILFEGGPIATPTARLSLSQNYPNPFNPSTEIRFSMPERCFVVLEVIDASGALVARLVEGYREKGAHSVSWNGRDVNGREVGSGVYFYRLRTGKQELSRKMVLAR